METRSILLTSRRQMIDLNKEFVSFQTTFKVQATNPSDAFEGVVVDQSIVDDANANSLIQYNKSTNGIIEGDLINDSGVYQNYFLLLKSQTQHEIPVTVTLHITDTSSLPPQHRPHLQSVPVQGPSPTSKKVNWWLYIGIGLLVILVIYYFYQSINSSEGTIIPRSVAVTSSLPPLESSNLAFVSNTSSSAPQKQSIKTATVVPRKSIFASVLTKQ